MRAIVNERRKRNDEGFTLIELLLVIIILGILAAVVVFSVRGVSDRGQSSACKTSKATTIAALEAYYAKNNAYPTNLDVLKTDGFLADLPNPSGSPTSAVNGPSKNGGGYEWTIAYVPAPTGSATPTSYTLNVTAPTNGGCGG